MLKVFFDLDGVIRDLGKVVFKGAVVTDWLQPVDGKYEFFSYMKENMHLLEEAPPTQYYDTIYNYYRMGFKEGKKLNILTHQPKEWRSKTKKWIKKYFPDANYDIMFVDSSEEKLEHIENGVLIDDHPKLVGNSQVIAIDSSWNQPAVNGQFRIKTVEQLEKIISYLMLPDMTLGEFLRTAQMVEVQ